MASEDCGVRRKRFFGDDAAFEFCRFFFSKEHEDYTLLFHNGQAYDVYFLARYIYGTLKQTPKNVIYRGSKIVAIDGGHFRIIDSLCFLSFPLSNMLQVFGLQDLLKGMFPVFFNKKENWTYNGSWSAPEYYGVNTMKPKAREEFMRWHADQQGKVFNFKDEITAYCDDDVNILQESCNAFRSWLLGITSGRSGQCWGRWGKGY
jgi:hypothetical protein